MQVYTPLQNNFVGGFDYSIKHALNRFPFVHNDQYIYIFRIQFPWNKKIKNRTTMCVTVSSKYSIILERCFLRRRKYAQWICTYCTIVDAMLYVARLLYFLSAFLDIVFVRIFHKVNLSHSFISSVKRLASSPIF